MRAPDKIKLELVRESILELCPFVSREIIRRARAIREEIHQKHLIKVLCVFAWETHKACARWCWGF